jgi:hypothetical protein
MRIAWPFCNIPPPGWLRFLGAWLAPFYAKSGDKKVNAVKGVAGENNFLLGAEEIILKYNAMDKPFIRLDWRCLRKN